MAELYTISSFSCI